MENNQHRLFKQGLREAQKRLIQIDEKKINEQFLKTPEHWQCHQCRKITYDLLKGTFTYNDTFNIDKHLQQLVLKGFYALFSGYQPINKGLTKAQVKKKERLQNCWRFIFLNTCHAIRDHQEAISISLNGRDYNKDGKYHCRYWSYDNLKEVVNAVESYGYFQKYLGQKGNVSFITRLKVTDKFRQLIKSYILENSNALPDDFTDIDMIEAAPLPSPERVPVIIKIKDGVYKIPSRSSSDIQSMCKRVEAYNQFMRKQEIVINFDLNSIKAKHLKALVYSLYRNETELTNSNTTQINQYITPNTTHNTTPPTNDLLVNRLLFNDYSGMFYPNIAFRFKAFSCQRIFSKDMKNGGRVYCIVVQQLSENIRKQITINGEPVVELDYGAFHPSLLYSEIGLQPPEDIYVYKKGEETEVRSLIKIIALVGFNAKTEGKAINAIWNEYFKKYNVMLKNDVIKPGLELFFDHNPELKQFFGKGKGKRLQFVDSQIMDNILTTLRKENIPAIPIYDSVVVPVSAEGVVHDVMVDAYQKVTKTSHTPYITQ